MDSWLLAGWGCKILLYISMAMSIGGLFALQLLSHHLTLKRINNLYVLIGSILGITATFLAFAIQVGSFADQGWQGMFDYSMASMIMHSDSGTAQLSRVLGFTLILLVAGGCRVSPSVCRWWQWILGISGAVLLAASFAWQGHAVNIGSIASWLILLHILAMSLWMGALFPLWRASHLIHGKNLQDLMYRFGKIASVIVLILLVCGLTVAVLLLKDFHTLLATDYGQGFMLKLFLVGLLLLLAASNKWLLTPALHQPNKTKKLSMSIMLEMLLGLLILTVTAYITSVIGIE